MQQQQVIQELDMDIYNKLLKCGIFRANPRIKMNFEKRKTLIDAETSALLENGVAIGKYLAVLKDALNVGISVDNDTKSLIVAGDADQTLMIITRIDRFLQKIAGKQVLNLDGIKSDINLSSSTVESEREKSNARRGNKPNQKKKVIKEGVDILTMNYEREPQDTESSLELILNTLCRAFQMKPKQAAALLTNNNQFLIHSIVKGVKGRYEPLLAWYQDLYANSKHLSTLLELELEQFPTTNNIQKVLATLSCGLYSHNIEICKWCNKLLTKIGFDFGQNQLIYDQAMKWFLEKEGGLELNLHALKKHNDLAEDFAAFVFQFSQVNDQIEQVYKVELKKYFSSPLEYVNVINDLLPFLVNESGQEVKKSGILDFWIESCIRQADNDGKHSYDERISALTLLTEIWLAFTNYVEKKEEHVNQIQQMLKRGARDKHRPIRMISVSLMFKLLDKFAEDKNNSAPSLYKTLIFSLCENPNDSTLRELYFVNFTSLFESQQSIPVNLLIEPLIKQIQVSENITYFFKVFDFDFFSYLAKHPKLYAINAIPLADILAKIYLNDVTYSNAASVPFIQLCSRFIYEEAMQEFLIKFVTICLSMMMGLEKNAEELQLKHQQMLLAKEQGKAGKRFLALPAPPKAPSPKKISGKKLTKEERARRLKEQDEDVTRRLKKAHIVELGTKILNLKNEEINDQLRDMFLSTNKRFNELYGFFNKGIMALLKWWGDSEQIMGTYLRAIEEREQREREEQERKEREEKERIRRIQEEKERQEKEEKEKRQKEAEEKMKKMQQLAIEAISDENGRLALGYESADQIRDGSSLASSKNQNRNSMAVLPYTGNKTIVRTQKALQQIEKIKRNKLQKEEQKRLEEERKRLISAKQKKKLKEQIEKRKLELGVGPSNMKEDLKALIYKSGAVDQDQDRMKKLLQKMMTPEIKLIDLEEEEERDKEAILAYFKKYAKLWKNLYYKYANSGYSSKQINNFDQFQEKSQTINFAEVTKMLKDHNAYPLLINKDELATLFRLINFKLYNKPDVSAFDYNAFQTFIIQFAFFCFTKMPRDLSHLPPVETIKALISHFEQATRNRGNSIVLYEDPDITHIGDQQLIKALNEKLKSDPNYPIPEGYFKQVERIPIYEYKIPESISYQIDESKVIGVEIMDDILNILFGIHILEPLVSFEEHLKVRPIIKNQFKPQAEALNYMKRVEKKIKPIDDQLNPYASLSALQKMKINQEVKPQLNVTLKLEVAQYPLKERSHVQEVAEFMEELLQACEKGLDSLPPRLNRAPGQVWNEAKQKKTNDIEQENNIKITKEDKRKNRDEYIKNKLKKINEQKMKGLEETKEERDLQKKLQEEEKRRQFEELKQKIENKKKRLQDVKESKLEEIKRKREEEQELKREIEEQKKKERSEFMKYQKKKMEVEFTAIKKEREDVIAKQEEIKKKEQEFQLRLKQQMEDYIKETQQDRGKEQVERKQIDQFMKQHDVESIFGLYDKSLRYMYKFYSSQDKKDIHFQIEKSMNSMNLREFVRFGYQQMIIPVLLEPEDLVHIFRELIRERIDEIQGGLTDNYLNDNNLSQVLDYTYFKKALIRIAIMAQDHLGGLNNDLLLNKLENETKLKNRKKKKITDEDGNNGDGNEKDNNQQEDEVEEVDAQEPEPNEEDQQQNNATNNNGKGKNLNNGNGDDGQETTKIVKKKVKYEINETAKKNEDAFFKAWIKKREDAGISLKKRIIGRGKDGKKIIIKKKKKVTLKERKGGKGNKSGHQTQEEDNNEEGNEAGGDNKGRNLSKEQRSLSVSKKFYPSKSLNLMSPQASMATLKRTKDFKLMKELENIQNHNDQIAQTKIENIRVRRDLDVEIISAKTIEALLKFLEITPEDPKYILDKKLNQHRIEIQGQKPHKIKKMMKPNNLEEEYLTTSIGKH